jgi:hypothetical protein
MEDVGGADLEDPCEGRLSAIFARAAKHVFGFFLMVVLCNLTHYFLRPFSQPRITSETLVSFSHFLCTVRSLLNKNKNKK